MGGVFLPPPGDLDRKSDPLAREALTRWLEAYGSTCGDLALACLPGGGIWLAGHRGQVGAELGRTRFLEPLWPRDGCRQRCSLSRVNPLGRFATIKLAGEGPQCGRSPSQPSAATAPPAGPAGCWRADSQNRATRSSRHCRCDKPEPHQPLRKPRKTGERGENRTTPQASGERTT